MFSQGIAEGINIHAKGIDTVSMISIPFLYEMYPVHFRIRNYASFKLGCFIASCQLLYGIYGKYGIRKHFDMNRRIPETYEWRKESVSFIIKTATIIEKRVIL